MEIASNILQVIGFIMAIVGGIAVLIKMFQVNILWGLCGLSIPIASWAFLAMHWDKAKDPFILSFAGFALVIGGMLMTDQGQKTS